MPTQPPLPPLLTPYVSSLPQSSLTLVSSVLGATGNWLLLRYLYAVLGSSPGANTTIAAGTEGLENDAKKRKVVLVSFLRGWDFWRAEAKRLGLDLARLADKKHFAFVDGLSELFYAPQAASQTASSPFTPPARPGPVPPRTALPVRGPPAPVPGVQTQPAAGIVGNGSNRTAAEIGPAKRLHLTGQGTAALDGLERDIQDVVQGLKATTDRDGEESEVLLIIDQPDLLLAATGPNRGIGATEMNEWILGLQENAYATIVGVSADSPLIHNVSEIAQQQATPLEKEHASFVVGLAHRAQMAIQLRNLETGAARDVSGVLRASKGGAWNDDGNKGHPESQWEEKEVLYFVHRDGSVHVFGRGE